MKRLSHEERIESFRTFVEDGNMLELSSPNAVQYEKLIQVLDEDYGYFDCRNKGKEL